MFLIILSLFSLVKNGYSISCVSCFSGNIASCSGGTIDCPDDNQCLSLYMKITIDGATANNFFRSCAPKNQCNMTGTSSFPGGRLEMAATCCSVEDLCTPDTPQLAPTANNSANGKACRQCQSINSDQCDPQNSMSCYGNETMCIRLGTTTTVFETSAMAFQGCATRSICNIGQQLFKTSGLSTVYNYVCSRAAARLQYSSVILLIICAILLNYI